MGSSGINRKSGLKLVLQRCMVIFQNALSRCNSVHSQPQIIQFYFEVCYCFIREQTETVWISFKINFNFNSWWNMLPQSSNIVVKVDAKVHPFTGSKQLLTLYKSCIL